MSERENVQRIEQVFAAFGRGDIPYILSQLTSDVRWVSHLDPVVPWGGDYSGKDNVPKYFQALGGDIDVSAHPVHHIIAQADTVVAKGTVSFRRRSTGKAGESCWVYVFTLREGRIAGYEQFNDTGLAEAFR